MAAKEGLALVEFDEDGVDRHSAPTCSPACAAAEGDSGALALRRCRLASCSRRSRSFPNTTRPAPRPRSSRRAGRSEFRELIGAGRAVVEFGSGSSVKTPLLLDAIEPAAYVPLDISGDFLRAAAADLAARFPGLPVHPVEADFMREVALPERSAACPSSASSPARRSATWSRAPRSTCCARCARRWAKARCC
jgi:L-histidine Nalpha-methyltransferase